MSGAVLCCIKVALQSWCALSVTRDLLLGNALRLIDPEGPADQDLDTNQLLVNTPYGGATM
jgi:hypothetical protein